MFSASTATPPQPPLERTRCDADAGGGINADSLLRRVRSQGSGVVDVAGGKGSVSFELVSRHGIPVTLIDPRPLRLSKSQQRLLSKRAPPPPSSQQGSFFFRRRLPRVLCFLPFVLF